ncbi:hypothetical protein TrLO_g283 [Triparma laevis f. longispina]|uniref:Uncharacterized protein n=1 Tax=Triparma laevis f. longispina TaxID=1714387 RepID=A0A9W7KX89_9STRA|nr:hypothetical protein TrLO_g283 [Triparma laevis f. longispina]
MFKKELAEARELLAKKDEELQMRDLEFRKQERDTKSSLRSLKMKLLDAEVHEEEEKHKLEVAYKKEL